MFNSFYEIVENHHRYFGNVTLKECHLFKQDGEDYLLNVETMTPYKISKAVARLVDKVALSLSGALISERALAELIRLDLVVGFDRPPTSTVSAPAAGGVKPAGSITATSRYAVRNIALFVAQTCNMACVYCYGQGGEYNDKGIMNTDTAFKAVDWLMVNSGDINSVNIGFFGGEPMMNFSLIKKVVKYARQEAERRGKEITFDMTTNASLLSDQRISYLRKEDIKLLISFDGTPEIHNRQRPFTNGKGSFDRVYANLLKLKNVFPYVRVRATFNEDSDPADINAGLEQAGIRMFSILKASPVMLNDSSADAAAIKNLGQADERYLRVQQEMAHRVLLDIKARTMGKESSNSMVGYFIGKILSGAKRPYYCGAGRGLAAITMTGDIYPCHRFVGQEEMKIGNINSYVCGGVTNYHRAMVDNLPECKNCWVRYACGGGCLYNRLAFRGDIRLPDRSFCLEMKSMMKLAMVIVLQLHEDDKLYAKDFLI